MHLTLFKLFRHLYISLLLLIRICALLHFLILTGLSFRFFHLVTIWIWFFYFIQILTFLLTFDGSTFRHIWSVGMILLAKNELLGGLLLLRLLSALIWSILPILKIRWHCLEFWLVGLGHACLGISSWVQWRVGSGGDRFDIWKLCRTVEFINVLSFLHGMVSMVFTLSQTFILTLFTYFMLMQRE